MPESRERFIETNKIKLHVMEAGPADGPLILFLHGFPEFWYSWRKQIGYFADKGYLVCAPDQRGYNLSDRPEGIGAYKVDELAKDVLDLIDCYGRDKIFLVGHDWGAAVSWWLALKYPQRIERLVIMNVPHPLVMMKNLMTNPKQIEKSWYIFFFQLPHAAEKLAAARNFAWLLSLLTSSSRPGTFSEEDLDKYREAYARPGAISAMINWYRASLQAASQPLADFKITMPTVVIWGEKDVALIPEMADESMAFCEKGRLIKFPEASHWVHHEEAPKINELIFEFFKDSITVK